MEKHSMFVSRKTLYLNGPVISRLICNVSLPNIWLLEKLQVILKFIWGKKMRVFHF